MYTHRYTAAAFYTDRKGRNCYVCGILFDGRKMSCVVKNSEEAEIEELVLLLEMMS